ncbi:MAG TPA: holo-ACP synthase [Candidatus Dormibacteraeota bacterium]|nr:holo-ACP synthase [Candidatus Dormibacteraeota bacterium]
MIVGMGIDLAEVKRVEAAIARHGRAFLERVFTPAEIRYCEKHRHAAERYAARFAAKEAAMKALGTGWRRGVRWVDLEVANLPTGRPTLKLHGRSKQLAEEMGVRRIALSLTHGSGFAFAQVIFESD